MKLRSYDAKMVDGVTTGFFAVEATDDELAALLVHVATDGKHEHRFTIQAQMPVMGGDRVAAEFKAQLEATRAEQHPVPVATEPSTPAVVIAEQPAAERPKRTRAPRAAAAPEPVAASPVAVTNPHLVTPLTVAPLGSPSPLIDGNGAPVQVKVANAGEIVMGDPPRVVATQTQVQPEPAVAKPAAPTNGTIPKEVMEAPRHREVAQYLKDTLGWDRQTIVDWCVKHQAAVPALARLPAEDLVDRIDRTCNILLMK